MAQEISERAGGGIEIRWWSSGDGRIEATNSADEEEEEEEEEAEAEAEAEAIAMASFFLCFFFFLNLKKRDEFLKKLKQKKF